MSGSKSPTRPSGARRDRTIQESRHDTYKTKGKLPEPTLCLQCGAVYHKGRWTWGTKPPKANETLCPACERIKDKYPAGWLTLKGSFLKDHREEILGVARNAEKQEKAEHPLSRIMAIKEQAETIEISATDTHLPQHIGEALHDAYEGELTIQYSKDDQHIRVTWARDAGA